MKSHPLQQDVGVLRGRQAGIQQSLPLVGGQLPLDDQPTQSPRAEQERTNGSSCHNLLNLLLFGITFALLTIARAAAVALIVTTVEEGIAVRNAVTACGRHRPEEGVGQADEPGTSAHELGGVVGVARDAFCHRTRVGNGGACGGRFGLAILTGAIRTVDSIDALGCDEQTILLDYTPLGSPFRPHANQHANIVYAALNGPCGQVHRLPIIVARLREEGQNKGGQGQLVLPQPVDSGQLLYERIVRGGDAQQWPVRRTELMDAGVHNHAGNHAQYHGHHAHIQHGTLPLTPQPSAVGFVFADDRTVGLVGLDPVRQFVELARRPAGRGRPSGEGSVSSERGRSYVRRRRGRQGVQRGG
mmetsp:Transcript_26287/g.77726  ORF Transcript_26287/g.77726 Transcript_26287/m.77726 type:complete len:358 (-) Transcript_26287:368-1441(-)